MPERIPAPPTPPRPATPAAPPGIVDGRNTPPAGATERSAEPEEPVASPPIPEKPTPPRAAARPPTPAAVPATSVPPAIRATLPPAGGVARHAGSFALSTSAGIWPGVGPLGVMRWLTGAVVTSMCESCDGSVIGFERLPGSPAAGAFHSVIVDGAPVVAPTLRTPLPPPTAPTAPPPTPPPPERRP